MNTTARIGVYVAGLFVAFGVAAGVGAAAGPIDVGGDDHDEHATRPGGEDQMTEDHGTDDRPTATTVAHAEHGSALQLAGAVASAPAGAPFDYSFTVEGADGAVVDFDLLHERRLHLIVVSADLVDFWHVHPTMTDDGTWHVEMPALAPGVYAVYADVQPTGGEAATLRQRLVVTADGAADAVAPRELPAPAATAEVGDFQVTLSGTPAVGTSTLQFDVSRDGRPVTTEPYLGAAGHLVAIRASDLAYLHVHPLEEGSPAVRFAAELATAGTYRLFLDFSVDGTVHTASFTLDVPAGSVAPPSAEHGEHGS